MLNPTTQKTGERALLSLSLDFAQNILHFVWFLILYLLVCIIAYFSSQGQNRQGGLSSIMNVFMRKK